MNQTIYEDIFVGCIDFAQRLIRTPSMSHREEAIAALLVEELRRLGFDEARIDGMGNVHGRVYGRERDLPALVLNTHLDHVDPGDPALWPVPPFAGVVAGGRLIGRGACDIKGPLAVQVYALAALLRAGERPRRDVILSSVVQEEIGGAGAVYWAAHLDEPVALILLGEPSQNNLALGHRGIAQFWVTFSGRSGHASAPQEGENPNYALAEFLVRLPAAAARLFVHPRLGPTSVAPTIIEVDTASPNVTPAWTRVLLDFRTAGESNRSLLAFIAEVAGGHAHVVTDAWCPAPTPPADSAEPIYGFDTPPDSEVVLRARAALGRGMGREPELVNYRFATDGRHFVPYGIPVLGFAPGEDREAHTAGESISLAQMDEALCGLIQLVREF